MSLCKAPTCVWQSSTYIVVMLFFTKSRRSSAFRAPRAACAVCPARHRKRAGRLASTKDHWSIGRRRLALGGTRENGDSRWRRDHKLWLDSDYRRDSRRNSSREPLSPRRSGDPRRGCPSNRAVVEPDGVLEGRAHLAHVIGLFASRLCPAADAVATLRLAARRAVALLAARDADRPHRSLLRHTVQLRLPPSVLLPTVRHASIAVVCCLG